MTPRQRTCPPRRSCGSGYGLNRSERRGLWHAEQVAMQANETTVCSSSGWTTARRGEREKRRPNNWSSCTTMAWTPWCGHHSRRGPRSRRPELPGFDPVTLYLEVQGLVVHPEESRRLTLVAPCGVKGQADRLALRLGGGPGGDLLQ